MAKTNLSVEKEPAKTKSDWSDLISTSQLNFWSWDLATDQMKWSAGTFKLFGMTPTNEDMMETFANSISVDNRDFFFLQKEQLVVTQETTFKFEFSITTADTQTKWIEIRGETQRENGKVTGLFGVCHDTTSFKQNETELKQIQQQARIGFWHLKKNKLHWSRGIRHMVGLSRGDSTPNLKEWIEQYIHIDDRKQIKKTLTNLNGAEEIEMRHYDKDGNVRVIRSFVMPSPFDKEKIIGSFQDVTSEIETREDIAEQTKQFDEILQGMIVGVAKVNMDGIITFANEAAQTYLEDPNMVGRYHVSDSIDQMELDGTPIPGDQLPLSRSLHHGEIIKSFEHGLFISGALKWFSVNSAPLFSDGKQIGAIANFIEITEEIEAQKRLQDSEARFRKLIEEAPVAIQIYDKQGNLIECNARWEEIWNIDRSKVLGYYNIFKDNNAQRATFLRQVRRAFEGKRGGISAAHSLPDDKTKEKNTTTQYFPLLNSKGKVENVVILTDDVTEKVRAEKLLRESEEFQHETIDALSIGLIVIQKSGRIEQTNKIWDKMVMSTKNLKSARVGANFLEVIKSMPLGTRLQVGLSSIINNHSPLFEMELQLDSGRWYSLRASNLHAKFSSIVITLMDITVRKRVEQALEDSLGKYRSIYNMTPVMMHSIDANGTLVSVSNYWLEKMGYQRHEVIGKHLSDFLTEESKKDSDIVLPIFFEKGSIYDVSYHFVTQKGEVIETILSSIQEGKGTANARSLSVVTDITALKKAERQLKQNREDLLEAQSIARIGSYELDIKSETFTSSTVFDEILEIKSNSQKRFDLLKEIAPKGEYPNLSNVFKKVFNEGKPLDYVGTFETLQTKRTIWLECLGRIVYENGVAQKMIGTIQDVTKNKIAEIEIQKLSDRLKLAMEGANIGVWESDIESKKFHWEATMYDLFEIEPPISNLTLMGLLRIVHPDDRKIITKMRSEIKRGKELVDHDFRMKLKSGIKHFRAITRQIKGPSGKTYRMVGVVIDISRDRELLKRLEQSLSEKDILIKEVHHRVKNNMQMISSILALKALDLTDQESKNIFDDCTVRIKSMAVVHDQLYRFYNVSEISISEYLHHLLSGLNALMGGQTGAYVIDIEADEFKMDVDIALLCGLIVSELVANAFKHGFKGQNEGRIQVIFKKEGDKKKLLVTNTGNEIPDDVLEIKTTSLGMSLIKTFTTQLNGTLSKPDNNGLLIEF